MLDCIFRASILVNAGKLQVVTNTRYKIIWAVVFLILAWNISAWIFASKYYLSRVEEAVAQKTELSQERAGDLADSVQRNLNYLHGIPDLLSQLLSVKGATSRFGPDIIPSALPLEERKNRWTKDPGLNDLSKYLELAKVSLNADIVFVINAAGDCIAASNWNAKGNTIGTNFLDREYFKKNKEGHRGMQYAVGKTTNIPGLYFSTPVMIDGHFMGAVVAKTDVPNLSFLIKELDAFITDENGVIVLAHDKKLEMLALPGASVTSLPEQKKLARYRRASFPVFQMDAWGDKDFPSLMRVQYQNMPHVFASSEISKYGMKVFVGDEIEELGSLSNDVSRLAFLLGLSGSFMILMVGGAILYTASIKATEIALSRANSAERRIISISEDTQQRIGRELHDDLGQLLTGIAFMSEVLFDKLSSQDRAEAQDAARITAFINDAIAKTSRLAHGLYPVELNEAGLSAMLDNLAKNTEAMYPIKCEFICKSECRIDEPLVVINLFRIAQEAVNNAIKHGNPTKITLELKSEPSSITLSITDNGIGIDKPDGFDANEGIGMRSMQYRASLLGGNFSMVRLTDGGIRVAINFPV